MIPMDVARGIARLARQRNRELAMEASVELLLGVLFCALTFGAVFWAVWIGAFFTYARFDVGSATLIAGGATALYAIVAFVSAMRGVAPAANVRKLTDAEFRLMMIGHVLPFGIGMQPRHALAGVGMLLIAGPKNILDAWNTWRHRLPTGRVLFHDAAELLDDAARGQRIEDVRNPLAGVLLHRLGLITARGAAAGGLIVLTRKGEDVRAVAAPLHR
jgi:hypothetical protein